MACGFAPRLAKDENFTRLFEVAVEADQGVAVRMDGCCKLDGGEEFHSVSRLLNPP